MTAGAAADGRRLSLFWMLLPFALGYGGSYFFRNVNAVAGPVLAAEFGLGPGDLGFLTSAYFLAFSAAQIPLGIALDRWGPALVNAVMLTCAAAGATIFGCADSEAMLILGRCLIGAGAGAALMSAMSAVHAWAPGGRAATYIGLVMTAGGLGAILASTPTQWLIDAHGWRMVFFLLAATSCAFACANLGVARRARQPAAAGQSLARLLAGVVSIYADMRFWRICVPLMFTLGTMLAFQSLWAALWMRDVAGIADPLAVANVLVAFNLGMTAAFLTAGWLGDTLKARGVPHVVTVKAFLALALVAQAWLMAAPAFLPHLAWGMLSYGANALMLGYALLAEHFPAELTGRVNTSLNLMSFSCAFFVQWGIGLVVSLWPAAGAGYAPQGYYAAWGILFAVQLVAVGWLFAAGGKSSAP
ncbi:MAG: MFS transporter [Burkholderiales bacterium]|nr:MFS transporter [Burkholderiales bacterium]